MANRERHPERDTLILRVGGEGGQYFQVQAIYANGRQLRAHELAHVTQQQHVNLRIDVEPMKAAKQKTIIGGFKSVSGMNSEASIVGGFKTMSSMNTETEIVEMKPGGRRFPLKQYQLVNRGVPIHRRI